MLQQGQNKQKTPLFNENISFPLKSCVTRKARQSRLVFWALSFDYTGTCGAWDLWFHQNYESVILHKCAPVPRPEQLLGWHAARCPADTRQCYSREHRGRFVPDRSTWSFLSGSRRIPDKKDLRSVVQKHFLKARKSVNVSSMSKMSPAIHLLWCSRRKRWLLHEQLTTQTISLEISFKGMRPHPGPNHQVL